MQVLFLTEPESWSAHATYQATRLFVSNLNTRLAQRFLALVLLPAVRQDIREHQRLHFALFQALKKAAYKPDAFYKVHLPRVQTFISLSSITTYNCRRWSLALQRGALHVKTCISGPTLHEAALCSCSAMQRLPFSF